MKPIVHYTYNDCIKITLIVFLSAALFLFISNKSSNKPSAYPIFEIKHSPNVIITVFGQGLWDKIWGTILINKNTLEIVQIQFDHIEAGDLAFFENKSGKPSRL